MRKKKTNPRRRNRTVIKRAKRVVVLNPRCKHLPGATAKQNRQYEHILKSELDRGTPIRDAKRIAAATVRAGAKNPSKRIKIGNSQKYTDLVIRGKAKKTPHGWKLAGKTFAQGRGTAKVSSGYYLDRRTGLVYARRERSNPRRSRKNPARLSQADIAKLPPRVQAQIEKQIGSIQEKEQKAASAPTDTPAQRKRLIKQYRSIDKQKRSLLSRIGAKLRHLAGPSSEKITAKQARRGKRFQNKTTKRRRRNPSYTVEAIPKYTGKVKETITALTRGSAIRKVRGKVPGPKNIYRYRVEKNPHRRRRRNETPEQIRREFAGSVFGARDLYFPEGTPQGLAKLGKLVSITTEDGTIKPVAGSAWLCADTKGHLHLGSTSGAPLYDGPKRDFGEVSRVEYEDVKKHLGYTRPTIFFHHVGERTGERPTLHADGRGGLVFKGGAYWIGPRGLEN